MVNRSIFPCPGRRRCGSDPLKPLDRRHGTTSFRSALSISLRDVLIGLPNVLPLSRGATAILRPRAVGCSRLLDRRAGRKVEAMKVAFELPPAQADRLREEAARLGVAPDELAKAALADLLATDAPDFDAAARRVLDKNRELYRRLA